MKKLLQIKKGVERDGDTRTYIVVVEFLPLPGPGLDGGRCIAALFVDEELAPGG